MGWQCIEDRLSEPREAGSPAIIPYLTVGFPDVATTLEMAPALEEAGAAVIELGVPFSDPLADGPTVQQCGFHALRQGVTLRRCLEACATLRARGLTVPLVFMGYYNPLLAYGLEALAGDAASAGLDGFIVPDLPAEEAGPLLAACEARELAVVPLLAPTSTDQRVAAACGRARGFVYCVSRLGITGARQELSEDAHSLVRRVRQYTDLPVAVGFGVSSPEHVAELGKVADAVVVGSALLKAVSEAPPGLEAVRAREFLARLGGNGSPTEGSHA